MSTNTITTSALPPGSTVYVLASPQSSFQASSFANDLFNSLAPLLTLFGEQPTRQYLSMSLSLADHILLGIAPIGILTIVVSAIRISGSPLLKALVGRSRENRASIEAEVLSSTSTRVRELWDGERIVKEAGESRTTEVIYNQKQQLKTGKMLVQTFPNAVSGPRFSLMYRLQTKASGVEKLKMAFGWNGKAPDGHNNITSAADEPFLKERLQTEAPNISLNVSGAIALRAEIWVFGIIGYVLQLGVLAVAGLSVYRFDWRGPKEASIPAYAFPCFATGTVLITIFTTICGYIIEATTTKETYGPALTSGKDAPNPYMVFRVQRESTIGRQDLPAYAIFNDPAEPRIRTARPNKRQFKALTLVSTAVTVIGFAAQFIGIRAMHWSIALMQLGATFMTTGLRTWARRGMARRPDVLTLETNWEAVDLALHIRSCDKWELMTGRVAGAVWLHDPSPARTETFESRAHEGPNSLICDLYRDADRSPEPSTKKTVRWFMREKVFFGDQSKTPRNLGHRILELHRRLQKIFPSEQEIEIVTSNICEAISQICNFIFSSKDIVLANLDTAGKPADTYIRPFFDVLVEGKTSSGILPGLIQLGFVVKWPVDEEEKVVDKDARKRIRSIFSLTHRSLAGNKPRSSDDSVYQPRGYFMRIIGYQDQRRESGPENYDYEILRSSEYMRRWLDHGMNFPGFHEIPFPDGTKPMVAIDATVYPSPIFGMRYSSLCKVANLTTHLSLLGPVATPSPRRRKDKKASPNPPAVSLPTQSELVFLSDASLANNIALDIMSNFLLTLTAEIEHVGGITVEVEDEVHGSKRWENDVLEKLAQILIDVGLASNMGVAKTVIIPAFAARWLLPAKTARSASEGMANTQMPADWTRRVSESGRTYFANHETEVTSWTHPWFQKPDEMWREMHSNTPPPAYTPRQEPREPESRSLGFDMFKPSYPPSLIPDKVRSRDAYRYEEANGATAESASIYSEVILRGEEGSNGNHAPPRPASC